MNKIFKIIWNKTTQRLEVVSELAKSQGKATASADKRESLNDSSLKGFKLTQGLKPLSLLVAFAIAMPSYATVTEYNKNQPNSLHIWGRKNVSQGGVSDALVQAAVITGTGNALGDERPGGAFFPYDNRNDSGTQVTPNAINIFGRDNKVNVGNKVNLIGTNNTVLNNAIGNSGTNLAINAMGNNIAIMNPRRSSYFGNDIYANSAYLGIGNNLTVAAGGQAVGTDIRLSGDSMAFGSSITTNNGNNFLVGNGITATNQNQFISGKNITSGLLGASLMGRDITINQGWADNLVAVGNSLTVNAPGSNSAANAVVMGVSSTITGGAKAVTIGSNVTSTSASNSVTIGSDISTNKPNTVTIGSGNTKTEQNYSIAIGNNASTLNNSNDNGIAIGRNSVVRGDSGIALGLGAESYNAVDVAIGRNSKTSANTNSTLSAWSVSGENVLAKYNKTGTIQTTGPSSGGVVSFGSDTVKRQLKNVAAGDVSATSTDAINGAQLYALAEVVKPGTLTIKAGTTKVADWKANSNTTIGFESTNSNLAVSADAAGGKVKFALADNLTVSSVTASGVEIGKNNVAVNAKNKKITELADATLSTTSTDAVTGRQLQATNANVTNVQNIANTANANASAAKQAADNAAAAVSNSYLHVKSTKTGNLAALNANGGATGDNSVALGPNATAAGSGSIAIGDEAVTSNNAGTIAIGQNAAANTNNATVIGRDAKTVGAATDSVVIGLGSIATSTSATAIGKNANASGASSISIGQNTVTTGSATAALGYNVTATGANATAVGSYGNASGNNSITVGSANASGSSATAVGAGANAAGGSSAAFGQRANATNLASLALGYQANATGNWTVAVGGDVNATGDFAIAMGNRANASALNATSIGRDSAASGVNATAVGTGANAALDRTLALGRGATANTATGDVAIGDSSTTSAVHTPSTLTINGKDISANFQRAKANGDIGGVVSVGSNAVKRQIQNVGAGDVSANSTDAINGSQLYHVATELNTLATAAKTTADNTAGKVTALEARTQTFKVKNAKRAETTTDGNAKEWGLNKNNEITFGATSALSVSTDGNGNIIYDLSEETKKSLNKANSAAAELNTMKADVAAAKQKADAATAKATDAATKADAVTATANDAKEKAADAVTKADAATSTANDAKEKAAEVKAKVDNSGLDANGQNTKVGSGSTYAGGSNATAIGGSTKATKANTTAVGQGSEATAKGATAIGQGAKATGENAVAIGTGSVAGEANTVSVGSQGNERRITNVAAGKNPTDAANVGQINAAENRMNNKLGKLDKKLRSGVASAVAVANIPQVTIPGASMVALGVGNYKGQSAVAVGYSRASDSNRVIIKMTAGASTQRDYTFGAGIGYQW
ncbi:hypothetical protein EUX50_07120 [Haemophilus haemolyticus]|uniref:Adhesin n=1 Tax=Haemophilus haemolyticus TaxID=726 RepID=A0ABY2YN86_HAEHA|nr:YadA-like family protein [Haemophilus haemolyticus]TPH03508.1 hypothetical protein EUX50_07120 [Haemophilus haemolyticus]